MGSFSDQETITLITFAGSGYPTQGEGYRNGGLVRLVNLVIFPVVGTP